MARDCRIFGSYTPRKRLRISLLVPALLEIGVFLIWNVKDLVSNALTLAICPRRVLTPIALDRMHLGIPFKEGKSPAQAQRHRLAQGDFFSLNKPDMPPWAMRGRAGMGMAMITIRSGSSDAFSLIE